MKKINEIQYRGYCFGTRAGLSEHHYRQLTDLFEHASGPEPSILGGRAAIMETVLDSIGDVVIKTYQRGGLIRFLIRETYLNLGTTRCQAEYEQMNHAYQLGIHVPKPVAYAFKGGLFYKGWLITEKIHHQKTLADLSRTDLPKAQAASVKLAEQISRLMDHHIFHQDLHPGNVLVTEEGKVFIIDFDKAGRVSGTRQQLASRYLKRWKRAVTKYQLPDVLSRTLENGLLS
ncbi:MAG: hypothetical protein C4522_03125 [Desulfobacteraceae bacterium]|nr:MAG: hypothetical protein C4522_03125 [Desulfobacteraceae bacterium]